MKLAFVFALLASLAVLSLTAPTLDGDEAMLEALAATLSAETHDTASADSTVADVQTKSTPSLGYTGKYDNHLAPVVDLLQTLRLKLVNAMKASQTDVQNKKAAMDAAQIKADEIQRQALSAAAQVHACQPSAEPVFFCFCLCLTLSLTVRLSAFTMRPRTLMLKLPPSPPRRSKCKAHALFLSAMCWVAAASHFQADALLCRWQVGQHRHYGPHFEWKEH